MNQTKRGMTSEDLYRICFVSDPQLSPKGDRVAYVQTIIDEEKAYRSHLFVQPINGDAAIPVTDGNFRDSFPRWSPDGTQLSFVSNRSGQTQIWLISADGGEAKQLTSFEHEARDPVWSPDGKYLLFSAYVASGETLDHHETDLLDSAKKKRQKPMVVERLKYKSDDLGFLEGKTRQLAIIDVETGELFPLTHGDYDHAVGSWSPDGQSIALTANRSDDPDRNPGSDLYLISVKDREWKKLTDGTGLFFQPTWSPDGKKIAFIGSRSDHVFAVQKKIWVHDVENGEQSCISAGWDVHVGDAVLGDMRSPGHPLPGPLWSLDGNGV